VTGAGFHPASQPNGRVHHAAQARRGIGRFKRCQALVEAPTEPVKLRLILLFAASSRGP
jgi:hypothetical protein